MWASPKRSGLSLSRLVEKTGVPPLREPAEGRPQLCAPHTFRPETAGRLSGHPQESGSQTLALVLERHLVGSWCLFLPIRDGPTRAVTGSPSSPGEWAQLSIMWVKTPTEASLLPVSLLQPFPLDEKYDGKRNIKLKEDLLLPIPLPPSNTHTGKDFASYQEIPAFTSRVEIWRARRSPMQDAGEF